MMSLGNESFEGTLIENVDESFAFYHLLQLTEQCHRIVSGNTLDTHRLTDGIGNAARLAEFHDTTGLVGDDLDFLLTTLMAVQRQGRALLIHHPPHGLRITQDIAIHQQEVLAIGKRTRHPKRKDIVVVLVVGIMDEMDVQLRIMLRQKTTQHLSTIACHHHQLVDAGSNHRIDSTSQQRALAHLQQTLRTRIGQRTQALCHSRCKNYSYHTNAAWILAAISLNSSSLSFSFSRRKSASASLCIGMR